MIHRHCFVGLFPDHIIAPGYAAYAVHTHQVALQKIRQMRLVEQHYRAKEAIS